ncbi:hypothetical protein [Actinomadura sp. 9N407]|uniref:hypothetical protein n=1 Tax=Actinomadura sp. 9N407 TaxID=3375154 RepID=UPI00379366C6
MGISPREAATGIDPGRRSDHVGSRAERQQGATGSSESDQSLPGVHIGVSLYESITLFKENDTLTGLPAPDPMNIEAYR